MKVYEIEAQKIGKHQTRWTVSDPELPTSSKERAHDMVQQWARYGASQWEYRVVEYTMQRGEHGAWVSIT